jgi:hypothetical protein
MFHNISLNKTAISLRPFQAIVFENRFDKINITSDWWDWAEATIVNQLRVAALYNGQPPYGLRGYIGK